MDRSLKAFQMLLYPIHKCIFTICVLTIKGYETRRIQTTHASIFKQVFCDNRCGKKIHIHGFFHFKTIYMVCIFKAINLKMNILQYITRVTT